MSPPNESAPDASLDDLSREIDGIDDAIHDLLMRRTALVERIAEGGQAGLPMRPAREATILRRLAARHAGPLPQGALVRMWREMMSAQARLSSPFAVAVHAPEDRRGFWDIARDHFGSSTPMTAVNSPAAALRAVSDGSASVAVVPVPEEEDPDPWWRFLMSADPETPRVVARLPFLPRGPVPGGEADALAIAAVPHEPTGDDRTLLGLELVQDLSRGRLKDAIEACGLATVGIRSWFGRGGEGSLHMVEIADFLGPGDRRLAALSAALGEALARATPLGGYAVPLPAPPTTARRP
jgi:chorismate mutase